MKSRRGFTLMELLVVMAIISILAALLLSALAGFRQRVRTAVCLQNLKRWGVATHLYASEHNDLLPPEGSGNGNSASGWYIELPRILGLPAYPEMPWRTNASIDPGSSLWICPSNRRRSNGVNLFHYCLNDHVNGTGENNRPVSLWSIPRPAVTVWLFDNGKLAAVAQQNNVHTNLHSKGAQFLFLDGRAKWFRNKEYWDFKADKGRTNNPGIVWFP